MRILLVEDDPLVGDGIQLGLKKQGFSVEWVQTAMEAEAALMSDVFDAMILDVGLPQVSGFDFLKKIRQEKNIIPVLILTARHIVDDRVEGLNLGADDYMVKPFSLKEVGARLQALIRRVHQRAENKIVCGDICIYLDSQKVEQNAQPVDVIGKEYLLLKFMVENHGKVLAKERLESLLFGWQEEIESNSLEVHIHNLRKKFGKEKIKTLRNQGYVWL